MKVLSRLGIVTSKLYYVAVHEDQGHEIDRDEDLDKLLERLDKRGKEDYIIQERKK